HGELRIASDYFFTSSFDSKEMAVSGGVVFCGDAGKVDFEKSGVSGKWALCLDDGTELRKLRAPAKTAGAIGRIRAAGPADSGDPYEKRFARDLERLHHGFVSPRKTSSKDEAEPEVKEKRDEVYPALMMGSGALSRLLAAAGAPPAGPAAGTDLGLDLS